MAANLHDQPGRPERGTPAFDFDADAGRIPGWLTRAEGAFLHNAASATPGDSAIVEIGSFKGRSTICLGKGACAGHGAFVFAIDPHHGNPEHRRQFGPIDTFSDFLRNIETAGLADVVAGIRDTSVCVAARFKRPVGLLFVDGNHQLGAVREDLRRWLPLVRPGGLVAVHDSWQIWGPHVATAWALLHSRQIRNPRLIDTITCFETTAVNTLRDRLQNRAFVVWRLVWGFKGFLRLKMAGTCIERLPVSTIVSAHP